MQKELILGIAGLLLSSVIGGMYTYMNQQIDQYGEQQQQQFAQQRAVPDFTPPVELLNKINGKTTAKPVVVNDTPTPTEIKAESVVTPKPTVLAQWQTSSAKANSTTKQDTNIIHMVFDNKGTKLLTQSKEYVRTYDAKTGSKINDWKIDFGRASLAKNGRTIAMVTDYGAGIAILDGIAGNSLGVWASPVSNYHSFTRPAFTTNGNFAVTIDNSSGGKSGCSLSASGRIGRVWPITLPTFPEHPMWKQLIPLPAEQSVLGYNSTAKGSQLYVLHIRKSEVKKLTSPKFAPDYQGLSDSLTLAPDDRTLAIVSQGCLQFIDWKQDRLLGTITNGTESFGTVCYSPDGEFFAVSQRYARYRKVLTGVETTAPSTINIYSATTRKPIAHIRMDQLGLSNDINAVAFSHDGKQLAIAVGPEVRILDTSKTFGITLGSPIDRLDLYESQIQP